MKKRLFLLLFLVVLLVVYGCSKSEMVKTVLQTKCILPQGLECKLIEGKTLSLSITNKMGVDIAIDKVKVLKGSQEICQTEGNEVADKGNLNLDFSCATPEKGFYDIEVAYHSNNSLQHITKGSLTLQDKR